LAKSWASQLGHAYAQRANGTDLDEAAAAQDWMLQ